MPEDKSAMNVASELKTIMVIFDYPNKPTHGRYYFYSNCNRCYRPDRRSPGRAPDKRESLCEGAAYNQENA
ncbi:MAG TPA: hypothetical protein PLP03_04175 [Bacteroidales bacterium]|nr:hypothetical protein [Bacteroidales bacterium]